MKDFFRNYGADVIQLGFLALLLGTFLASAILVRRSPAPPSAVAQVPPQGPMLSGFAPLPPPKTKSAAHHVKRKAEPKFEKPQNLEVPFQPADSGFLK